MLRQFAFFVFIWLLEMLEAVFGEGLSIGLIFLLAVTILRETRRRKHSTSVETSSAKLAAAKKERKAYKCHEEMSFADDQGDSRDEEEEAPM